MESQGGKPEQTSRPQTVLELMLGRHLSPEEEHMPINFHVTVSNIDSYIEWADRYDFIKVIEPRTRFMGGWEAAVLFPEGQTITFWQERWAERDPESAETSEL
jgi:hypothetical protein